MPTISWFNGTAIRMYFDDHAPPHFHAVHGGDEALISIADGALLEGRLPRSVARDVQQWTEINRAALLENWDRARSRPRLPLFRIPGLDAQRPERCS